MSNASLEKFRQVTAEIARKQERLKKELAKRPSLPQPGDIFIFEHPKTLGLQWVVLETDQENSQTLSMVPADNNPMVGSTDIGVPDHALSGPISLRCGYRFSMNKDKFNKGCLRIGLLDDWDLQHASDKIRQISEEKIRSSVLQQEADHDPDYKEWMEQVSQGREALKQTIPAVAGTKKLLLRKLLLRINRIYQKITEAFTPLVPIRTVAWAISAAIVVLTLSLVFWPLLGGHKSIGSFDDVISSSNSSVIESILHSRSLDLLWEDVTPDTSSSHFSEPPSHPSLAVQAFRAGLWNRRQELLSLSPTKTEEEWLKKDWLKTEWASYFKLGQWILLLETVCQLSQLQYTVSAEFWDQQKQTFAQLKLAFLERREKGENLMERIMAKLVIKGFEKGIEQQENIGQLLEQLSNQPHLNDYVVKLGDRLKTIRKGF